ncbi:delta(14)-sterol reductase TM7SF2-like isoform X1 [Biomphalaria glabrata]|uniref:Delta(14)-sterol reductase n=1 Tax=Biomphalaria glabrata TaxID=6526 RepID=A0A9W2ZW70_BIOGL|nr:delta(14)-sterol reductase TM7SF2-like isoform X1 [Biomphalaria glabrata]XP_055879205.1 delta(14)-sterol reductase TM7SF2-like isoform X1 [Biomphalaria glabrata]XP_055879206.1 delta(14)-sterol reductase TM7SF2-like isoform X1 [Biomphalaria glabrata]XP_055879207.1 delta(14)-sterol reductase TM7SF2-like isoform X1 [Biomphalaria glabrata]KAI8740447.1 delta(14)-sterol reductase TM7SF2 [Biomphalaria glabrata]KAI8784998.1 delta(14)-sterol reductase TM7SF2 [Biomphalaria glabrata]
MSSPKKTSKSPGRSKARGRSTSASRKVTRSRSRSSGRKPKAEPQPEVETTIEVTKSTKRIPRPSGKSPSRVSKRETTVTTRIVTSNVSAEQEQASVTPVRTSSRISSILEKEREESARLRDQLRSEMLSNLKTPPPLEKPQPTKSTRESPHYEFMGPIGTFFLIFLLPFTVYYINWTCRKGRCSILEIPKLPRNIIGEFFEVESMLIFLAWFFFQVVLALLPVGSVYEGQPLKSGGRLKYRCNGFFALIVSLLTLAAAIYFKCPVTKIVDKFYKLMTSAVVFSISLSVCLYISSRFVNPKKLAPGGNTGNVIYDFFIGRELNPRVGSLDLKFFCELRPGLIGWVIMDWIMVYKAYETGTLPANLILVTVFQTIYVADALWFESAILTTMDIIHDGFGFMLAFGDLAWVPFLYSLQPRFLYESKLVLPWYCLAPIALLNLVGYTIFRLSNSQKDRFRRDPKDPLFSGMEVIPTQAGKKLLVSGWWGLCRKPNYLGDLIMALSWSLTTGFGQILTYFYPIYFLVLLIHRERRDFEQCQKKYGSSWNKYCEKVPYRIFPYIY